jgi:hypothetical protein
LKNLFNKTDYFSGEYTVFSEKINSLERLIILFKCGVPYPLFIVKQCIKPEKKFEAIRLFLYEGKFPYCKVVNSTIGNLKGCTLPPV